MRRTLPLLFLVPRLTRAFRVVVLLGFALGVLTALPRSAHADGSDDPAKAFALANNAIQRGAYSEAINTLELLADHGFVHPNASFNRAVAYVDRARSSAAEPGDLGRAAAALSEVLQLRPNDEAAQLGLSKIRAEISRRHAREGTAPVMARPSLGRAVTSLFSENVWASVAMVGSLLLALGLGLRRFVNRTSAQLAGSVGIGIGALLLAAGASLTAGARHFRLTSQPAVVVVEEARLLDKNGNPLRQEPGAPDSVTIPEGASVYVLERGALRDRVAWGSTDGWVTPNQVEILATR